MGNLHLRVNCILSTTTPYFDSSVLRVLPPCGGRFFRYLSALFWPVAFLFGHFAQCSNAGDDGLYGLGHCGEQLEAVFHADLYAVIAVSYGIVG